MKEIFSLCITVVVPTWVCEQIDECVKIEEKNRGYAIFIVKVMLTRLVKIIVLLLIIPNVSLQQQKKIKVKF